MRRLAVALLVAISSAALADEGLEPYTVKPGDTCVGIARRRWGTVRLDLLHAANPNLGPTPHHLRPGQILMLPREGPAPPEASIAAVARDVRSRGPEAPDWSAAAVGQDLFRAWKVNTLDDSSATIRFGDASQLFMREQTLVIIFGRTQDSAERMSTRASLERGTLRSRLAELAGQPEPRLELATPSSDAEFGGGAAVLAVDEKGRSAVSNLDGKDALVKGRSGKPVKVQQAMGTTVAVGAPPAPPRPLPASPSWNDAPPVMIAGAPGRGATIRGSWHPVVAAARYHVEVATEDGTRVTEGIDVPAAVTSIEIHGVPPGRWRLTVAAIDADGLESRPSPASPVAVAAAALRRPGGEPIELAPIERTAAAPAPARVLPGTRFVAPGGMRCAAGDGPQGETVTFTTPGPALLRCATAAGEPAGAFPIEVVPVVAAARGRVVRGVPSRIELSLTSELSLPEGLQIEASPGVTVEARPWRGREVALEVLAGPGAPSRARLSIAAADAAPVTSLELAVEEPPPVHGHELASGLSSASILALRPVEGPRGPRAWAALGTAEYDGGGAPGQVTGQFVIGAAARLRGVLLRGAGHFAFGGEQDAASLFAGAGLTLVGGGRGAIDGELAGWFPLGSAGGEVVFQPSFDAWARPASRWMLRTRQGGVFGGGETLAPAWASAYGVDLTIWRGLRAGAELDLSIGDSRAAAVRGVIGYQQDPFSVSVGVRVWDNDAASRLHEGNALILSVSARYR